MTTTATTKQQILDALDALSADQLEEILDFIQRIQKRPQGIPGKELADFFRRHALTQDEIQKMAQIQEEIRGLDQQHGA